MQLLPSKNWVDLPFHGGECGKQDAMCALCTLHDIYSRIFTLVYCCCFLNHIQIISGQEELTRLIHLQLRQTVACQELIRGHRELIQVMQLIFEQSSTEWVSMIKKLWL
jgi:hypothetical protein